MISLDSKEEITKIDKSSLISSIELLPDQVIQAWDEVFNLNIPESCPLAKNVVISGMGGSALGGRIVDSLLLDRMKVPIEIVTEYSLPNYVNNSSLVILSSYSGNTEETLSAANEAINRGAIVYGVTTGGKLGGFIKDNKLCGCVFSPMHNPSGQPRMGLGYSITIILAILARCKFIDVVDTEIKEAAMFLRSYAKAFGVNCQTNTNPAKEIACNLYEKIPVIMASEHLIGSAYAFKNQLNENGKTFSILFDIPEANHHLMEGLANPKKAKEIIKFLLIISSLYSQGTLKRFPITKDVIEKNGYSVIEYQLQSRQKLLQIFEVLSLGLYVAYYLSILNEVDPTPIPWVDYFKEKLR